ncbi:heparan-alpha-glucosaminide N-acetyltransferase domain-containing protein [Methanogenium cariaci]|uniref:heparan-alpha-glucosaminide N-acetyltransferase domain-containing protein n=1 Tax=Methanogenium cariaci TaxID=2197 RepID=UPI0007865716|nr:heparan-alpha-glucosaminide N-acetyltransferase domain-containing protein [Methanogenium cariaci]
MEQAEEIPERPGTRFWEIDAVRGIAILMMVVYHLMYDLVYFGVADMAVTSGFWRAFALTCACTFVFLVGLSLHISRERAMQRGMEGGRALVQKFLMRGGLFILALGGGISLSPGR